MSPRPRFRASVASRLGFLASKSSSTRGRPWVISSPVATPPVWKVRMVSCVPGSPMDCAAMMPTASPTSTRSPCGHVRAIAAARTRRVRCWQVSTERTHHFLNARGLDGVPPCSCVDQFVEPGRSPRRYSGSMTSSAGHAAADAVRQSFDHAASRSCTIAHLDAARPSRRVLAKQSSPRGR